MGVANRESDPAAGAGGKGGGTRTERGLERFIFFTDAVTAVAITLLVLPLVDEAVGLSAPAGTAEFFAENGGRVFAFVLSFLLIGMYWTYHHRFSELLVDYDGPLIWLNLLWMLAIVTLPLTTELMHLDDGSGLGATTYIANLMTVGLVAVLMRWHALRTPGLLSDPEAAKVGIAANLVTSALFAVALVVSLVLPAVGTWGLLLLLLARPARLLVGALLRRRSQGSEG